MINVYDFYVFINIITLYYTILGHTQPTNQTIRYSTSGVPPATAQSSYQSKARSNFLLGPSKSVIFDKSDMQVINFVKY